MKVFALHHLAPSIPTSPPGPWAMMKAKPHIRIGRNGIWIARLWNKDGDLCGEIYGLNLKELKIFWGELFR
jgi:hypothetical protein